ncbi:hypothetical protein NQ317_016817 [Molorchus minor]|uniref:Uncharacterized protein n=1 Tax=Molorchus minor TaxID=1323400 RepID=A0ABQ9JHZ6_9CUCU|nr:hypothetical protein NQ317_016817 [Molorchus minor]
MLWVPGRWVLREHRSDRYQRRYRLTENPDIIYRTDTYDLGKPFQSSTGVGSTWGDQITSAIWKGGAAIQNFRVSNSC